MRIAVAIGMVGAIACASAAWADTLAHWTFEVSQPMVTDSQTAGPYSAELGLNAASSFASGFHARATTDYSTPVGNGSQRSFSSNEWTTGDYYQFTTSTLGYKDILIGWDQTRSNTGPATFDLLYSTDGVNFKILVDDYTVLFNSVDNGGPWNQNNYSPNFTFAPVMAPSEVWNQPLVVFRLASQVDGGTLAGTNRVDDVMILGTVPAPGAAPALGAVAITVFRRRRA